MSYKARFRVVISPLFLFLPFYWYACAGVLLQRTGISLTRSTEAQVFDIAPEVIVMVGASLLH